MIQLSRRIRQERLALSPQKVLFAAVIGICAILLLVTQLGQINWTQVGRTTAQIQPLQWIGAIVLTAISFVSWGQYDVIWHRIIQTGVPPGHARRTGMAAIAFGQTIGFCSVTSGIARWRGLSGVGIKPVAKVSAAVAVTFMTCWAALSLPALWHVSATSGFMPPSAVHVLALLTIIAVALVRIARTHQVPVTSAITLLIWTTCDMIAAAGALYILLPASADISFSTLFAAYILALGAGIFSNAPGGIGVFEVVLIAIVAPAHPEGFLAAILGFRIVYYLLPFVIGCIMIARPKRIALKRTLDTIPPAALDGFLRNQAHASWGLARQNGSVMRGRNLHFFLAKVPFSIVSLGDPLRVRQDVTGHIQLQDHARLNGKFAIIYQASHRMAAKCRQAGWHVIPCARRAFLDPQTWTTAGSSKQGLRRKIAQAVKSNVVVTRVKPEMELADLTKIAKEWSATHGGQMGFSMGTFCPDYVKQQAVFTVSIAGQAIGFITFHVGKRSWALDLMRYDDTLPSGAMQAAVAVAIEAAKSEGVRDFCLAAAPIQYGWQSKLCKSRTGLSQFKQSFRPSWQTLYVCAPNLLSLAISGTGIVWAIQDPIRKILNWCVHGPKIQSNS